jgi:hypothetical protein
MSLFVPVPILPSSLPSTASWRGFLARVGVGVSGHSQTFPGLRNLSLPATVLTAFLSVLICATLGPP